jgi:ribosomal protein S12 methylthiotransferase
MEVQREISLEQNESRIGKETIAVIERADGEYFVGRTEWDAPEIDNEIFISQKNKVNIGDMVKVAINDATEYDLYGDII